MILALDRGWRIPVSTTVPCANVVRWRCRSPTRSGQDNDDEEDDDDALSALRRSIPSCTTREEGTKIIMPAGVGRPTPRSRVHELGEGAKSRAHLDSRRRRRRRRWWRGG